MNTDYYMNYKKFMDYANKTTNPKFKSLFIHQANMAKKHHDEINEQMAIRFWKSLECSTETSEESSINEQPVQKKRGRKSKGTEND